jgi:hypothetical protein
MPNNKRYQNYGGRGIKVCDRWQTYQNFKDDMYEAYLDHKVHSPYDTTLERINNDGDYTPDNCTWATYKEQNNNHRVVNQHGPC